MRTFTKTFRDERLLTDMLIMRQLGWTLKSLAILYGVDHSSVYKWCKITNVSNRNHTVVSISIPDIISLLGIKPVEEKMYKDYLNIERSKRYPKLYALTHNI